MRQCFFCAFAKIVKVFDQKVFEQNKQYNIAAQVCQAWLKLCNFSFS